MMLFPMDTHFHFDLYKDRLDILNYIEKHQSYTIAVTNLPELFSKYRKEMCWNCYKYIRLALGYHPQLVDKFPKEIDIFCNELKYTKYVGEIGLDYCAPKNEHPLQKSIFERIICECDCLGDKVLSIHSRKAESDILAILDKARCKVILHWYSGNIRLLEKAVSNGFYFSINHQMINSVHGQAIIKRIPLANILLESDAPFSTGMQHSYSLDFQHQIYSFLTRIHNIAEDELSTICRHNLKRLLE